MYRFCLAIIVGLSAAPTASTSPVLSLSAQGDAYAIFGSVSANLSSNSETLNYLANSGSLGGNTTSNNKDISGVSHPNDPGSLLFVDDGTIGIRANNGNSSFKLEMPMLSTGFDCVPAFMKADEPSRGVTAFVDVRVQSSAGIVAQYAINNSFSGIGTAQNSNTTVTCPSSGLGVGALVFPLPSAFTDEYSAIIDIGYEIDGARIVSSGQFVADGADGEPFSGDYEFTLAASLIVSGETVSTSGNNGQGVGSGGNNAGGNLNGNGNVPNNNNGNGPNSNNGNGNGGS